MARDRIYNPTTGEFEDPQNEVDPAEFTDSASQRGTAAPTTQPAPFNRETYRQGWSGGSADQLKAYNDRFGVQTRGDVSLLPTGEAIDMITDVGGKNGYGWTDAGDVVNGQIRARPQAAPSPVASSAAFAAPAQAAPQNDFQNQIRALLLQKLQEFGKPTDPNDPVIAGQTEAYRNERTRSAERERAQMAERAAFQGLLSGGQSSGAFDTTVQGINEEAGQDVSGFKAQLMGRELENRRSQLASMLSLAVQSGDQESARALQLQIAQMDAELRRLGLEQQGSQFNAQLGQQRYFYDDTMGFNKTQADRDEEYRRAVLTSGGA